MPFTRARLVKINDAVHRAVVGDGERGEFQLFIALLSTSRSRRQAPIEQRITRCANANETKIGVRVHIGDPNFTLPKDTPKNQDAKSFEKFDKK